jgi:hypothetical protein
LNSFTDFKIQEDNFLISKDLYLISQVFFESNMNNVEMDLDILINYLCSIEIQKSDNNIGA